MKVDFLAEGSDACPLIRLYYFLSPEVKCLRDTFIALASGSIQQAKLHQILNVESVDGTRLTFKLSKRDEGVVAQADNHFEVLLTSEGWAAAADLSEPFCKPGVGYQWLTPHAGKIQLLLSVNGDW